MSTYSVMTGTGVNAYPAEAAGIYSVTATLDFTDINSGAGTVQNDIVQLIQVPANTLVLGVAFSVTTANATLTDVDIGDDATTDGYIDGASLATVNDGMSWDSAITEAFGIGKFYTTANTIDLKQNTNATITSGVIKVKALMIDCNIY